MSKHKKHERHKELDRRRKRRKERLKERVRQAMKQVRGQKAWTPVQKKWLNCIEKQLLQENTLSREDFSREPFKRSGGFERINRIFNGELADMIHHLNEYLYEAA